MAVISFLLARLHAGPLGRHGHTFSTKGPFHAALQGNDHNEVEVCIESGDDAVLKDQGNYMVYMHTGTNPFQVITQVVEAVEKHMQTFHHRDKKKWLPSFLDWFGWCTWDAFYTDVTADGVHKGLKSLSEGGIPPRFLIIDDGWQQIGNATKDGNKNVVVQEGAQFAHMLTGIKENHKFQKKRQEVEEKEEDHHPSSGLEIAISEAKQNHGVKVYTQLRSTMVLQEL